MIQNGYNRKKYETYLLLSSFLIFSRDSSFIFLPIPKNTIVR